MAMYSGVLGRLATCKKKTNGMERKKQRGKKSGCYFRSEVHFQNATWTWNENSKILTSSFPEHDKFTHIPNNRAASRLFDWQSTTSTTTIEILRQLSLAHDLILNRDAHLFDSNLHEFKFINSDVAHKGKNKRSYQTNLEWLGFTVVVNVMLSMPFFLRPEFCFLARSADPPFVQQQGSFFHHLRFPDLPNLVQLQVPHISHVNKFVHTMWKLEKSPFPHKKMKD